MRRLTYSTTGKKSSDPVFEESIGKGIGTLLGCLVRLKVFSG